MCRFKGLTSEDMLVYQAIQQAANTGIFTSLRTLMCSFIVRPVSKDAKYTSGSLWGLYRHLDSWFEEENKSSTAASKQGSKEFGGPKLGETSQDCFCNSFLLSLQTFDICPGLVQTHLNNFQGFWYLWL
jgi:hypothetical protein